MPRGSQDALGAGLVLKAALGLVSVDFEPPEPEKTLNRAVTSSLFVVFAILSTARLGSQKAPTTDTNIDPETVPEGHQRQKHVIQNRTSLFDLF